MSKSNTSAAFCCHDTVDLKSADEYHTNMSPEVRILKLNRHQSDGDASKRPNNPRYKHNDEHYLRRLGQVWAEARKLPMSKDIIYQLDRLPAGFAGYEHSRPAPSKNKDHYMYGHPRSNHRSVRTYAPHFLNLMETGSSKGCKCECCIISQTTSSSTRRKRAKKRRRKSARVRDSSSVEAEAEVEVDDAPILASPPASTFGQCNDIVSRLRELKHDETINTKLHEAANVAWHESDEGLKDALRAWQNRPSYAPRPGELVLYASDLSINEALA